MFQAVFFVNLRNFTDLLVVLCRYIKKDPFGSYAMQVILTPLSLWSEPIETARFRALPLYYVVDNIYPIFPPNKV